MNITKREREVLKLYVHGTAKFVAVSLGITEGTVEKHLISIKQKLGDVSIREAVYIMAQEDALSYLGKRAF